MPAAFADLEWKTAVEARADGLLRCDTGEPALRRTDPDPGVRREVMTTPVLDYKDIEAEHRPVRGEGAAKARSRSGAGEAMAGSQSADLHPFAARDDDAPPWRSHRRAGHLHRGGSARNRLRFETLWRPRTSRRCGSARSSAIAGSAIRRYFTVGNLVKHLAGLRQTGMTSEEIVERVRLRDGGSVRTLPLRDLRHRVPQGASGRRVRRIPGSPVPAAGRPQAGDRRGARSGAQREVLQGASDWRFCSATS